MKKTILYFFLLFSVSLFSQLQTDYTPMEVCDDNNDGIATFNLDSKLPEILAGVNPSDYEVSFYETTVDAANNTNPIPNTSNYTNINPNVQVVYVGVVNISTNEILITSIELMINPTPIVNIQTLSACFQQGLASFDLGSTAEEIWFQNNSNPNTLDISFHYTQAEAVNNMNALPYYFTTQNQITDLFVNVTNIQTGCSTISVLVLLAEDCGGEPCIPPINAAISALTATTANVLWTETITAPAFEYIVLPQNSATPSQNATGTIIEGMYQTQVNGLTPSSCYTFFIRSICSATETSAWTAGITFCTLSNTPTCSAPTNLIVSAVTTTAANFSWSSDGSSSQYEYLVLPTGSPVPTENATGSIATSVNQTQIVGLTPSTCYIVYVRTVCSATEISAWAGGFNFCTLAPPPACGGIFIDAGGANGNYLNNTNSTTTICPTNLGDVVTVTFTAFNTEALYDGIYVYDGNSTAAALIPSTNGAGTNSALNIPGAFWGTTIPGPFTSSVADGCLTFRFISDNTVVRAGWVANVTCGPPATCLSLSQVTTTTITATSATVGWLNPNETSNYEVLVLAQDSPVPMANATGFVATTTNPFAITGLQPDNCFTVYVRARCDANDASVWSTGSNFCTPIAPPVCGGTFIDNGGSSGNYSDNTDETTTICPTITGQQVTVTFTSFNVEDTWDALYVFDGNSITSPLLATTNAGTNVPGGLAGGYWGTEIPGPFTSTSVDGCLTFRFRSDNTQNRAGWVANVTCGSVDRVILTAFIDTNNNGVKDAGEINFNHGSFIYDTNNSGTNTEVYSLDGHYVISDESGTNTYDIGYQIQSEYAAYFSAGTTAFTDITIPESSGTQNLFFPITVTQTYTDVAVTIIPINAPRAGITNYRNEVVVTNLGNETIATTTLSYTKDSNLTVVNVSDTGATTTPTGFTRIFTDLLPNESRSIIVNMSVPAIPTVSIGQVLTNSASVTPPTNDLLANNNTAELSQPIVAAYDPNDKMESHGGRIQHDSFSQNDFLFYTIRFENTGNISAIDVKVTDILDSRIDETSVRMLTASHNYIMTRTGPNLVWEFKDIQLPVSIPNTQLGKGFITFKVKLKPGFAIGDIIPNTANIFFDTNPAIVTNTFNTEFVQQLSNTTFTDNNIVVYPNPATNMVNVALNNATETINSITVYDLLGKRVIDVTTISSNQISINTSSLTKGVYLLEINSNTNVKLVKKLVIQ